MPRSGPIMPNFFVKNIPEPKTMKALIALGIRCSCISPSAFRIWPQKLRRDIINETKQARMVKLGPA